MAEPEASNVRPVCLSSLFVKFYNSTSILFSVISHNNFFPQASKPPSTIEAENIGECQIKNTISKFKFP